MHFFIDPAELTIQDTAKKYGTVDPDKYRVTSLFDLAQASPAYAMQGGTLIVQPHEADSNLVNVMVKPRGPAEGRTHAVYYYVYRGIRRDSLFTGGALRAKNELPNYHFLYRLWESYENTPPDPEGLAPGGPIPADVGFDAALADTVIADSVFTGAHPGVHAALVREGDEIGIFGAGEIGVEIIIFHHAAPEAVPGSRIDLGYLRKAFHEIDVAGLSGIERDAVKELVHRYVDPAALFGTLYPTGLRVRNNQTGTVQKYRGQDLYDSIVSKFATRNVVYLDIRNDSGYAYNFYGKYGDGQGHDVQITDGNNSTQSLSYGTDGWPVQALDGGTNDFGTLGLSLRIDHNLQPLLFAEYVQVGDVYDRRFTDSAALVAGSTGGWTNRIDFTFPRAVQGAGTANVAQYLGMQYFEPDSSEQSLAFANSHLTTEINAYYNNAFCAAGLADVAGNDSPFTFAVQTEPVYINGQLSMDEDLADSDIGFAYAGDSGVHWDGNQVVFYASSVYTEERSGIEDSDYASSGREGLILSGMVNAQSFLVRDLSLYKIEIQEDLGNNDYHQVSVLNIHNNGSSRRAHEDVMFLGITRAEYVTLIGTTSLSEYHHGYPYLEKVGGGALEDREGIEYHKYRVGLIGIDSNRDWTVGFPATDFYVYSRDLLAFASEEFAEATPTFQFTKVSEEHLETITTFLAWNPNEAAVAFWGINELDRGRITWEEFNSTYITGVYYEYSFEEPLPEIESTPELNYSPIDAPAYFTQAEFNDLVDHAENTINGDPIEFYLIAVYKNSKLLNSSTYSVSSESLKIGEYILTPHYDSNNILKFYTASRNIDLGIEYIVRADLLDNFKSNYTLYRAAANAFYINGIPSRSQIQMASGNFMEGITSSWKEASRNPLYYMYMTHVLYGIGVNTSGISFTSRTIRNTRKISIEIENYSAAQFRNLIRQKYAGTTWETLPNGRLRLQSGNNEYMFYYSSNDYFPYSIQYKRGNTVIGIYRFLTE